MYQIFNDKSINTTTFQRGNVANIPVAQTIKYFYVRNKSSVGAGKYRVYGYTKPGDSFVVQASTAIGTSTLTKFSTNAGFENFALEAKADSVVKSVVIDAYTTIYTP